jgi:hypothetical protein
VFVGGLGLNLVVADTVIIFDSDWNPQNDIQAQARVHRIGQTKPVQVYRLITRNSYESIMFEKASIKLGLDKAVLHSMTVNGGSNERPQLKRDEIDALLKHGAYSVFLESTESKQLQVDEDIDQILARDTRVIDYTNTTNDSNSSSSFAKASFVSTSGENLDINAAGKYTIY